MLPCDSFFCLHGAFLPFTQLCNIIFMKLYKLKKTLNIWEGSNEGHHHKAYLHNYIYFEDSMCIFLFPLIYLNQGVHDILMEF
jgi:hypothetical protein